MLFIILGTIRCYFWCLFFNNTGRWTFIRYEEANINEVPKQIKVLSCGEGDVEVNINQQPNLESKVSSDKPLVKINRTAEEWIENGKPEDKIPDFGGRRHGR